MLRWTLDSWLSCALLCWEAARLQFPVLTWASCSALMPLTPSLLDPQSFCFWEEGTTASHSELSKKSNSDKKNLTDSVVGGFSDVCLIQKSTFLLSEMSGRVLLSDLSKKSFKMRSRSQVVMIHTFLKKISGMHDILMQLSLSFYSFGMWEFLVHTWNNPTALWQKIQNKHPLSLTGLRTSAATGKALTCLLEAITEHPQVQALPLVPALGGRGPLPHPAELSTHHRGLVASARPLTRQGLLHWEHLSEVTYCMPRYCSSFKRHSSKLHSSEHNMAHVKKEL